MDVRNPSGNFGSPDDDDDDDVGGGQQYSKKTRVKKRAELLSMYEFGDAMEAWQYIEKAEGQIKWEDLVFAFKRDGWRLVEEYIYHGPDGVDLFQSVRFIYLPMPAKKRFLLKHTNYNDKLMLNAGPCRVPYNLPEVQARKVERLYFVEGEKAVNICKALGLRVTCVQGQLWTDDVCQFFVREEDVCLFMDNDDAGRKNTARALEWLGKVGAKVRVPVLPDLGPRQGLDDWLANHTVDELKVICEATPCSGLHIKPYDWPDEASLTMWDFMLGTHLLRGTVSGTAASGGTGKSSLGIVEALALCSTKPIPGFAQPARPQRVWLVNLEDNRNAMNKRIAAAMKHYELSPADIGDRLHVAAKGEMIAKLAKQIRNGTVERNEPLIQAMVALLRAHKIDVLSIDPFINAHGVNENDNIAVREVVECFGTIAHQADCAVHLWHHTRKRNGQAATIDAARGAIAFVDACRCVRVLETMTKDDALKLNIIHPGFYFRAFNGKLNFAPPVEQSNWYKFENVPLDNNGPLFGDEVGVVTAWQRPATMEVELTPYVIEQVRQAVGPVPRWRVHPAADMWVGIAVAQVLEMDPVADVAALKLVIPKLVKAGALKRVTAQDRTRQERQWYVAGGGSAPEEDGGAE